METDPQTVKSNIVSKLIHNKQPTEQVEKSMHIYSENKNVNNKNSIHIPETLNISNPRLLYELLLFTILNKSLLNKAGSFIIYKLTQLKNLSINKFLKFIVYNHFCGGENVHDCMNAINNLFKNRIRTILDYSKESGGENSFDDTVNEILKVIDKASEDERLSHAVFKPSSVADISVLENISNGKYSESDIIKFNETKKRISVICEYANLKNVKVLIDAEQSWIQPAIDEIAKNMMIKFNKKDFTVFNTVQMYRTGRFEYLKAFHKEMNSLCVKTGLKIVRGAYINTEKDRAAQMNYVSPIQPDFDATTLDFHSALEYCIKNKDTISVVAGTHNKYSIEFIKKKMHENNLKNDNDSVYFAQLYGMANHISESLAKDGYNIAKYVPYGKVEETLPYLIRRFEENKSFNGQISAELKIRINEVKRRFVKKY